MKDVDMDKNILHVINAKNNKDRDIPVSGSVMEYIKWYGRKVHPVYVPDEYFFKSRRGTGHYEKTAVNHCFRDILFDCGIMHGKKVMVDRISTIFAIHFVCTVWKQC